MILAAVGYTHRALMPSPKIIVACVFPSLNDVYTPTVFALDHPYFDFWALQMA
jgi:hypothetical protein